MLLKLFKLIIYALAHYDRCPRPNCDSTNINCQNGIWHCYDSGHEW